MPLLARYTTPSNARSSSWSVKPELAAVAPAHQPAAAEPRRAAVEPRLQLGIDRAHQTRTSTTGIDGISPAANPARLVADPVAVEAHRHVELEPGRHRRARRRRRRQVHPPVAVIDREAAPPPAATPATATRTVPSTGFVIGRT